MIASSRPSVSSWRIRRLARGAEREPHRHLALAHRRACEQQVGDVRAGDQQHQPDDRHQQPARAHQVLAEAGVDRRLRERQERHAAAAVVVRVLLASWSAMVFSLASACSRSRPA